MIRGIFLIWTDQETKICKQLSEILVSNKAVESNPIGLEANAVLIKKLFEDKGCKVRTIENPKATYRPIIIAEIGEESNRPTVGFFGHYDVEEADTEKWSVDPWMLSRKDGRWYGRGVADNIVPLAQRIVLIDALSAHCNLVFVLQGEEEIGSPFAMEMYPNMTLPKVDIWVEETGYFYKTGKHRIMAVNVNQKLQAVIDSIEEMNTGLGRESAVRIRPMNKAFGNQGCPCLVHLLKDIPYIALGPNDDYSTIHGIDESINPDLLGISARHLVRLCEVLASG
ncbi:MAG TPA: M20/M25/M40 family metallo-hydrolase [Candidatus Poseidoniales archaeon]|nr:MAG TPA: M20/M25/M40 family metallo-hydrolase [Candidatus Poseidoniales archaeon]|tara:strand:+ start:119 stop:964 length:846 start_codon:yes stop_codon:yes gene_type:complete